MKVSVLLLCLFSCLFCAGVSLTNAQPVWQANLDSKVRFYQTTDFGIMLAGSEDSLYAFDAQTGERIWRKKARGIDETSVSSVPATDLILLSTDEGEKSRVEAIDLLSGATVWRSDKVKGDVMQLAVDPAQDMLAVVMAKKAKGKVGQEFKRTPVIHVFQLSTGDELWKKDLSSDVQMMPANFAETEDVAYTLDNYRPPLILDGRLYLFYEGVTSYDARTGKEGEREKFGVNEGGLALTEADPVFDEKYLYTTGKGKVRAVNRQNFKVEWEAKDLGVTPEMAVVGEILYVRTGGQFTRIKDGETEDKGSYGVSAIDTRSGKTLWRYKGADKGLTNFVFADQTTILVADKDDLITIDARTGKKIDNFEHDVEKAQFVLINESGAAVVGGRDEIAAFGIPNSKFQIPNSRAKIKIPDSKFQIPNSGFQIPDYKEAVSDSGFRNSNRFQKTNVNFQKNESKIWNLESEIHPEFGIPASDSQSGIWNLESGIKHESGIDRRSNELWRTKHKAPSRGVFRVVAGIALRAAALYFRYGGLATSALNVARGAGLARSILGLRASGLRTRFGSFDLTTLAANSAKNYVTNRISVFGIAARTPGLLNRASGLQIITPQQIRGRIISGAISRATPSRESIEESIFDRLDPARQAEKLSAYFLRRKRLAELRGNYMYFYTDLPKPFDKKGLVGVNVHTGDDARFVLINEPDARFTTDETVGLLYSANGNRIQAFDVLNR